MRDEAILDEAILGTSDTHCSVPQAHLPAAEQQAQANTPGSGGAASE